MAPILETCDLVSYLDAQGKPKWEQAMHDDMTSLLNNHTWYLVPQPHGKNIMKCRWVYQTNFSSEAVVDHHEAHLVIKVFSQKEDIEYIETFSLGVNMNFI